MTTPTHRLRSHLVVPFLILGLGACSPSTSDPNSGSTSGTGGVSAERTGGSSGSSAGSGGSNGGASASGGSGSSSSGGSGNSSSGGASGAGSGGSKGSGGSPGASSGGSSGGTPDASSGSGSDMTSAPPPATGGTDWVMCGGIAFKPGISAMEFCAKYESSCGFGGDPKSRYASGADCMTKYGALSDGAMGGKACVAWHLCIAGTPETKNDFCPHAPEASAMSGPCKAAYLY
jgi:hypothetical protein